MTRPLLTVFTAVAGAALFAAAATGAGNAGSTTTFTAPVHATLDASTCDAVSSDITLDGIANITLHSSFDGRGVEHFRFTDAIHGTAVDEDGNTYVFNYHDAGGGTFAGFPAVLSITDHFTLVGGGGANRVLTFFNIDIVFEDESDPGTVIAHAVIGDPETCDPL